MSLNAISFSTRHANFYNKELTFRYFRILLPVIDGASMIFGMIWKNEHKKIALLA